MKRFVTALFLLFGLGAALPSTAAAEEQMNACGCFRDEAGVCKCAAKKAKCVCPGDCEPVGCEAKREKDAAREAEATLKKIQAREKKNAAEAARQARSKPKTKTKPKEAPVPKLP
jgi:hypothetical protein